MYTFINAIVQIVFICRVPTFYTVLQMYISIMFARGIRSVVKNHLSFKIVKVWV